MVEQSSLSERAMGQFRQPGRQHNFFAEARMPWDRGQSGRGWKFLTGTDWPFAAAQRFGPIAEVLLPCQRGGPADPNRHRPRGARQRSVSRETFVATPCFTGNERSVESPLLALPVGSLPAPIGACLLARARSAMGPKIVSAGGALRYRHVALVSVQTLKPAMLLQVFWTKDHSTSCYLKI
jgi:hypothetical protein